MNGKTGGVKRVGDWGENMGKWMKKKERLVKKYGKMMGMDAVAPKLVNGLGGLNG